ncbi:unnamed protein product [Linum tenue]|uniref:Pentatricopeptide repeat-containing protein n=2 Tax=Linum tenue TaxID=586396 RepID=A0AAV0Q6G9_9ROSI|nr:unnamed protein product [Linum tenue]
MPKLPPILKRLDRLPSPSQISPIPPLPSPPPAPLVPFPTLTLTPTSNYDSLLNFLGAYFTTRPVNPQNLLHFFKSKLHHHPHYRHYDLHIFSWAATVDSFRHDHTTFEWMARSLANTNRLSDLTPLLQFMASNPCPCSEGIFSCPRIEPIFQFSINAYCKAGNLIDGLVAFETMRRLIDGRPNVAIYNTLINGFVKCGRHDKAVEVYDRMLKDRVKPDVFTFNILISSYCKNKKFEMALELFKEMREKGCSPNVVSFNTLIKGFFRQGKIEDGVKMAYEMIDLGIEFSTVTCEILVDGLCNKSRTMEACELLIDFSRKGVLPSAFDLSGLVSVLCEQKCAGRALELVYELWKNGNVPSLICSTTLVEGLRKSGRIEEAFRLMEKLLNGNVIVPDIITFNCLIQDVCKVGRTSDADMLRLLGCSKGLEPDSTTYNNLVSGYTAEGKSKEGEVLVEEMLDKDFIPDLATYNTLMNGLSNSRRRHRNSSCK